MDYAVYLCLQVWRGLPSGSSWVFFQEYSTGHYASYSPDDLHRSIWSDRDTIWPVRRSRLDVSI